MLTKQIIQKCSWWRNIPPSPLLEPLLRNSLFFIHFLLLFILLLASIALSMMFETVFLDLLFFFSSYPLSSIWWYYGWALHSVSWLYKSNSKLKFGFFFLFLWQYLLKLPFFCHVSLPPPLPHSICNTLCWQGYSHLCYIFILIRSSLIYWIGPKFCWSFPVKIVRKILNEFIGQPQIYSFRSIPLSLHQNQMPPPIFLLTSPHPQYMPPSQTIHCQPVLQKQGRDFFLL